MRRARLNFIIQRTLYFMQGYHWKNPAKRYAKLRQMERYARETLSPLERLETVRHPWVGFLIMPLFALANAGVVIQVADITMPVTTATMLSLMLAGQTDRNFLFQLAGGESTIGAIA